MEDLSEGLKESIIIPIYKMGDKTYFSNYMGHIAFVNYVQNFIQHPAIKVNCICKGNYCLGVSKVSK